MVTIVELLGVLNVTNLQSTNPLLLIDNARSLTDSDFNEKSIGWCSDNNVELLKSISKGTILVSEELYKNFIYKAPHICLIPVTNPRLAFLKVLQHFFIDKKKFGSIHKSVIIDDTVEIDLSSVEIGPNVVIEKGCVIGQRVTIGANTVIKSKTVISNDCLIGSNNTIGGVGFGYELNDFNEYELMPHIGNVVLNKGVEIGNNVCIDRAVMGSTVIGENVKIDNLVHIAHGVEIGNNSLVIANAMIAGSVKIGSNVWVAPSSSIKQKIVIEDDALIGLGSVVIRNVENGSVVAGNPAKPLEKK